MRRRCSLRIGAALLLFAQLTVLLGDRAAAEEVARPFAPRFQTRDTGDLVLIGNTTGTGAPLDVDADPATSTSSRATLALPPGGLVLWAGLYWGGVSDVPARGQVRFAGPQPGYETLAATQLDVVDTDVGPAYQGFADVTERVQAAGAGVYTVADVDTAAGTMGAHGGWALVVAVRDPAAPLRHLTVFDGFVGLGPAGSPALTVTAGGFVTPPSGPVGARIGAVTYGGRSGSTGDRLAIADRDVSDTANPPGDTFNASVAPGGDPPPRVGPHHVDHRGIDIDDVVAPADAVPNGASSVPILIGATDDRVLAGVLTSVVDDTGAHLTASATGWEPNGGPLEVGDTVTYTIEVTNRGSAAADGVVFGAPVPEGARYVPGTLTLTGAQGFSLSDGSDADQAEYDPAARRVTVRLGSGAAAAGGGRLAPGETTAVGFQVQLDQPLAPGGRLASQAEVSYRDAVDGRQLLVRSDDPARSGGNDPTLQPANNAPQAAPDRAETAGSGPVTIQVLANDVDADGDPLMVGGVGPADIGSAECTTAGSCTYVAPAGTVGTATFAYTAVDGWGLRSVAAVTVAVAAPPEPEPPAESPRTESPPTEVPPAESPPTEPAPTGLPPAAPTSTPPRCEPPAADPLTCVAGVSLSLAQASQAPRAVDDTVNVEAGQRAVLRVLDNDVDPDGDLAPASLQLVRPPTRGSADTTPEGVVRYTPYAGLAGDDELTYRICDAGGRCAEATVRLVVSLVRLPGTSSPGATVPPPTAGSSVPSTTASPGSATGSTLADGRLAGTGARTAQPATLAALLIGVGLFLVGVGERPSPARHRPRHRRRWVRRAQHRRRRWATRTAPPAWPATA